MPIRFTQGDILKLIKYLNLEKKSKSTYYGIGRDGKTRLLTLHFHGKEQPIATGTAKAMAKQLGFNSLQEMKNLINKL